MSAGCAPGFAIAGRSTRHDPYRADMEAVHFIASYDITGVSASRVMFGRTPTSHPARGADRRADQRPAARVSVQRASLCTATRATRILVVAALALVLVLGACGSADPAETGGRASRTAPASPTTTEDPATGALHDPIRERATADRPDDHDGEQVHVLYVLPADGQDEGLDVNGRIAASVALTDEWIDEQIDRRVRFDTHHGRLDVTFHRLTGTAEEYEATGVYIRDEIERDLIGSGFDRPGVIYAAYYAGPAADCASAFSPETLPGNTVGLYWVHSLAGTEACVPDGFRGPGEDVGVWEHSLAHELFHAFGAVGRCAPNHTRDGHVGDSPTDLMYAGDEDWIPSVIDIGRDDYAGHGRDGCFDLLDSHWMRAG